MNNTPRGLFLELTDPGAWKDVALFSAREHLCKGLKITIAHKGSTAAWRYPHKPELVPYDWEFEEATT